MASSKHALIALIGAFFMTGCENPVKDFEDACRIAKDLDRENALSRTPNGTRLEDKADALARMRGNWRALSDRLGSFGRSSHLRSGLSWRIETPRLDDDFGIADTGLERERPPCPSLLRLSTPAWVEPERGLTLDAYRICQALGIRAWPHYLEKQQVPPLTLSELSPGGRKLLAGLLVLPAPARYAALKAAVPGLPEPFCPALQKVWDAPTEPRGEAAGIFDTPNSAACQGRQRAVTELTGGICMGLTQAELDRLSSIQGMTPNGKLLAGQWRYGATEWDRPQGGKIVRYCIGEMMRADQEWLMDEGMRLLESAFGKPTVERDGFGWLCPLGRQGRIFRFGEKGQPGVVVKVIARDCDFKHPLESWIIAHDGSQHEPEWNTLRGSRRGCRDDFD